MKNFINVVIALGLASCGGKAIEVSSHADASSVDSGGFGNDAGSALDGGSRFPEAADASGCRSSNTMCMFCDGRWLCPDGTLYPQCPPTVHLGEGTNCSSDPGDFPCVVCGTDGRGEINPCGHGPSPILISCSR
jgi:hypothetical protein